MVPVNGLCGLQEEGTKDGCGYHEEDAGEEPAGCRFTGVGVATAELAIHLNPPDQPHAGANSIAQLGRRIEIRGHHTGCVIDTGKTVSLGKSADSQTEAQGSENCFFLHCRNLFLVRQK